MPFVMSLQWGSVPCSEAMAFHRPFATFQCGFINLQLFSVSLPLLPPSSHRLLSLNCTQGLSMRHLMHYVRSTAPALLTQCRGPMQTLAARRGTVGSAGRSFAHSLSTETACADWARGKGRRGWGEKMMVRHHSYEIQRYETKAMKL